MISKDLPFPFGLHAKEQCVSMPSHSEHSQTQRKPSSRFLLGAVGNLWYYPFFKKLFIYLFLCVYVWCVCTYVCLESPSNHVSPSTVQGFKVSKHIAIPVFLYEFLGIWTKVPMTDWQALFLRYCVGSGITCFVYLYSVSFQSKLPIPLNLVYHLVHRYKLPCKEAGS